MNGLNRGRGRALSVAFLLALCGCYEVFSSRPMGESDVSLIPEEWNGVWFTSDDEFAIFQVVEPERTSLLAWFLQRDTSGTPTFEPTPIYLRESGEWLFLSIPNESADPAEGVEYHWGRAKRDGDTLLFWLPDHDKFEKLVGEGVLPGDIASTDVKLGELDESHYAIITSEERGVLFDWDEPLILRRTP